MWTTRAGRGGAGAGAAVCAVADHAGGPGRLCSGAGLAAGGGDRPCGRLVGGSAARGEALSRSGCVPCRRSVRGPAWRPWARAPWRRRAWGRRSSSGTPWARGLRGGRAGRRRHGVGLAAFGERQTGARALPPSSEPTSATANPVRGETEDPAEPAHLLAAPSAGVDEHGPVAALLGRRVHQRRGGHGGRNRDGLGGARTRGLTIRGLGGRDARGAARGRGQHVRQRRGGGGRGHVGGRGPGGVRGRGPLDRHRLDQLLCEDAELHRRVARFALVCWPGVTGLSALPAGYPTVHFVRTP